MIWKEVESSQISAVGFDADSETLGIRFPAGKRSPASEYHYSNVPARVHRALIGAASVGSYFGQNIKNNPEAYPYTKIGETLPPESVVSDSALAKIDKLTPEEIFIPGTMDAILVAIKDEVDRQAAGLKDMTIKTNRDSLRSLSMRVVKSRTFIEGQRKGLVAARKKALSDIDAEARRISTILEGIEDEVRAPLTAWEQIDKDRKARHEETIANLQEWGKIPFGSSSAQIRQTMDKVLAVDPSKAEEFADLTEMHKNNAVAALNSARMVAEAQEAQKAQIDRLQAEANERAIKERERMAAEAAVEREKVESARREREAEERAELAEKRRIEAEQEATRKAEAAAAQAERDKETAIEAERIRVAQAAEDARNEAIARERNKKHRAAVHAVAIAALGVSGVGFSVEDATHIVEAISEGMVPHVSIAY